MIDDDLSAKVQEMIYDSRKITMGVVIKKGKVFWQFAMKKVDDISSLKTHGGVILSFKKYRSSHEWGKINIWHMQTQYIKILLVFLTVEIVWKLNLYVCNKKQYVLILHDSIHP